MSNESSWEAVQQAEDGASTRSGSGSQDESMEDVSVDALVMTGSVGREDVGFEDCPIELSFYHGSHELLREGAEAELFHSRLPFTTDPILATWFSRIWTAHLVTQHGAEPMGLVLETIDPDELRVWGQVDFSERWDDDHPIERDQAIWQALADGVATGQAEWDCPLCEIGLATAASNENLCEETFASKHEALTTGYWHGAHKVRRGPTESSRLSADEQQAAIRLLESLPWGDIHMELEALGDALWLALEATKPEFLLWEQEQEGELRYGDEFSLTEATIASMTEEWRAAYVARLIQTACLMFGMPTEFGDCREENRTIRGIVEALDIAVGVPKGRSVHRPGCHVR